VLSRHAKSCLTSRRDPLAFTRHTYPAYDSGWIHTEIAQALWRFSEAVIREESPRLIITLPPRIGKTFLAAERFPVWHLGRAPHHEIIVAGHNTSLSFKSSYAARRLVTEPLTSEVFPSLALAADSKKVSHWHVDGGGGYQAIGGKTGAGGFGAHILLLDDLIKGVVDAMSPARRDAVWRSYTTDLYTRLAPGGGILAIGTRWHEDDVIGRLIRDMDTIDEDGNRQGDLFEVIHYSALALEDEPHRLRGEALHPSRWSAEAYARIKRVLPAVWWSALYEGRPSLDGGNIWLEKWIQRYDAPPTQFDAIYHSVDCSFGSKSDVASYVVGQIWGEVGDDHYLLHQERDRLSFVETLDMVKGLLNHPLWGLDNPAFADGLVEAKANGQAVIDALDDALEIELTPIIPDQYGSKVARAHAVAPTFKARRVHVPADGVAPWSAGYVRRVCAFPNGDCDDETDATSQYLRHRMEGDVFSELDQFLRGS